MVVYIHWKLYLSCFAILCRTAYLWGFRHFRKLSMAGLPQHRGNNILVKVTGKIIVDIKAKPNFMSLLSAHGAAHSGGGGEAGKAWTCSVLCLVWNANYQSQNFFHSRDVQSAASVKIRGHGWRWCVRQTLREGKAAAGLQLLLITLITIVSLVSELPFSSPVCRVGHPWLLIPLK